MDGTLLDTQRICIPAWDYAGEQQGIGGMGSYIPSVCGMNSAGWSRYVLDRHPDIDMRRFNDDVRRYVIENGNITYKRGAERLLEFLRENRVRMAIASGSSRESIEHHLGEVGALGYFDALAGGPDVEHGKPAPDIFLLAAERIGADPRDCFVFEDSANGVRAAHSAGMRVIGIADIVPFDDDVRALMYRELGQLDEAIDIFRELI